MDKKKQEEIKFRMARALNTRWSRKPMVCPRLKTMCDFINATMGDRYTAEMEKWSGSFDRPIKGTRLISPGKHLEGMELKVYHKDQPVYLRESLAFSHNPLEAYRDNTEVARWIFQQLGIDYRTLV